MGETSFVYLNEDSSQRIHPDSPHGHWTIDSRGARRLTGLFEQLRSVESIPNHLAHNFNSLRDCLSDLDSEESILLEFSHGDDLLIDEHENALAGLIDTLNEAGEELGSPIEEGQPWDRGPIEFRAVVSTRGPNQRFHALGLPRL